MDIKSWPVEKGGGSKIQEQIWGVESRRMGGPPIMADERVGASLSPEFQRKQQRQSERRVLARADI